MNGDVRGCYELIRIRLRKVKLMKGKISFYLRIFFLTTTTIMNTPHSSSELSQSNLICVTRNNNINVLGTVRYILYI